MIILSRVTVQYGRTTALSDVTFTLAPRACVCITGPARAGKSTLLRLLLRAESPTKGTISIDNVDLQLLPPAILRLYRQRIGLQLAEDNLFLRKTVAENLTFPLQLRGVSERECSHTGRNMLSRLGLLPSADSLPTDLAAEACTLLGLGRALIGGPIIALLEEPFAHLSLDAVTLAVSLLTEAHQKGTTLLCLSRDESLASILGARHIRMASGKILDDRPSEVPEPAPLSPIHHIFAKVFPPRRSPLPKEECVQKVEVVAG